MNAPFSLKPVQHTFASRIKREVAIDRDFKELNKFFAHLQAGEVTEVLEEDDQKWVMVQKNQEGITYELLGSLDDFCGFFKKLSQLYHNPQAPFDDSAMVRLISKLRIGQTITLEHIEQAKAVREQYKWLMMAADGEIYNQVRAQHYRETGEQA